MKKRNYAVLSATTTALVASLMAMPALSADKSPSQTREVQRPAAVDQRLAQGMYGGNWEEHCDGMMDGMMMGGAMPRAQDPAELPEPDTAGARLVVQYCTQCHGLPSPKQHSAAGWPATVARMNTRMQWMSRNSSRMNISAPSKDELRTVAAYLEKHASNTGRAAPTADPANQ